MQYLDPRKENYFYGRLLRSEAETILTRAGKINGLFLLREKINSIGSYVLSICFEDNIEHYEIQRLENQNLKIEKGSEFIGPIELINFFASNNKNLGLCTKPSIECPKHANIKPVKYLFISNEDFDKSVENRIKKCCADKIIDATGRLRYKYEQMALNKIHLEQKWCVKNIDAVQTTMLFEKYGFANGKFLLRYFKFYILQAYKLSVCFQNKIYHHKIILENEKYYIEEDRHDPIKKFECLAQLIDYYGRKKGCLEHKLVLPYYVKDEYFCNTNQNYETLMLENAKQTQLKTPYIEIVSQIAYGPIANIYYGHYRSTEAFNSTQIVVKLLKHSNIEDTFNEMLILKELSPHPHIISTIKADTNIDIYLKSFSQQRNQDSRLLGGLNQANIFSIIKNFKIDETDRARFYSFNLMEYSKHGNLCKFLKQENKIPASQILNYIQQILSALEFIAAKGIIHRNVSARNVLIFDQNIAKLSGFGLAKKIGSRNVYEENLPIQWYPPEAIDNIYSEMTDVWSFGVLLWEVFSNGQAPFHEERLNTRENVNNFFKKLKYDNLILKRPIYCSDNLYNLMLRCWNRNAQERPSFKTISNEFEQYLVMESTDF